MLVSWGFGGLTELRLKFEQLSHSSGCSELFESVLMWKSSAVSTSQSLKFGSKSSVSTHESILKLFSLTDFISQISFRTVDALGS
jgi:hypothetical protein